MSISTPSVARRCTRSTSPPGRTWIGSVAGGDPGTTATTSRSIEPCANQSRSGRLHPGQIHRRRPDAVEFLQRLYPTDVSTIPPGPLPVCRCSTNGATSSMTDDLPRVRVAFVLTFTTGGAGNAEMWMRDWVETWGLDVLLLDRTMSRAINVTGPRAAELLARVGCRPAEVPAARPDGVGRHAMPRCGSASPGDLVRDPSQWIGPPSVARPAGGGRGHGHPTSRPPGPVPRCASRRGTDHRHGHRARHHSPPAGHGLGGEHDKPDFNGRDALARLTDVPITAACWASR